MQLKSTAASQAFECLFPLAGCWRVIWGWCGCTCPDVIWSKSKLLGFALSFGFYATWRIVPDLIGKSEGMLWLKMGEKLSKTLRKI